MENCLNLSSFSRSKVLLIAFYVCWKWTKRQRHRFWKEETKWSNATLEKIIHRKLSSTIKTVTNINVLMQTLCENACTTAPHRQKTITVNWNYLSIMFVVMFCQCWFFPEILSLTWNENRRRCATVQHGEYKEYVLFYHFTAD